MRDSDDNIAHSGKIRIVADADAEAITSIYNRYVTESVATFETEPLSVEDMRQRISDISSQYPYYVYEADGVIAGYCYAHQWKERAAYEKTLETTIYLAHGYHRLGIGRKLMDKLIAECGQRGYFAMIACITGSNTESVEFHRSLGFRQVSFFEKVGFKLGQILDVVDYELLLPSAFVLNKPKKQD